MKLFYAWTLLRKRIPYFKHILSIQALLSCYSIFAGYKNTGSRIIAFGGNDIAIFTRMNNNTLMISQ